MGTELADVVDWCTKQPGAAMVARVMSTEGFGGRRSGEVLGVSATGSVGGLASGAADSDVIVEARSMLLTDTSAATVRVSVGDSEAVQAGLACGGWLSVLLQNVNTLGQETAQLLQARTDLVVVTDIATGETRTARLDSVAPSEEPGRWEAPLALARRMLSKGPMGTAVVGESEERFFMQAVTPPPSLLVFGRAELADAIARVGSVLGWSVRIEAEAGTAISVEAIAAAGPNDGVVVLSHDVPASCAVLAAALNGRCGYVGALGSRHTQGARTQHLTDDLGIRSELVGTVRGPVGLDLGARSPEETALAIVAEMLAVIRQRPASPLAAAAR